MRTDQAAPRTMGYSSLEKTWKRVLGQQAPRPGPPKTEGVRDTRAEAADPFQSENTEALTGLGERTDGDMDS